MKISYQISFSDLSVKKDMFKEIEIFMAIDLFNKFDWGKAQNNVIEKLTNGEYINESDLITFKNSDNIKLSIESFDKGIYTVALFREKRMQFMKIPELINGSPKLRQSDVIEIIQYFYANDFKKINNICDRTRENSEFKLGPNALRIEQQTKQYLNKLQTDIRKMNIKDSISNLLFISSAMIVFGTFLLYILAFKVKGNDYFFKGFLLIVGGLMISGGIIILIKIKKQKNN